MPKIELIELHVAAAHFPIALLMSSAFFDVVGRSRRRPELRTTSYWCHLLGICAAIVTAVLGTLGNPFREDSGFLVLFWKDYNHGMTQKMATPSWVGLSSGVLFAVLAAWRVKRRDSFSRRGLVLYWIATAAAVGLLGATGYLGSHVMD